MQFKNNGLPVDNFIVYNILLVAKLFIRENEEKYCYIESFCNLKILLKVINSCENKEEISSKR